MFYYFSDLKMGKELKEIAKIFGKVLGLTERKDRLVLLAATGLMIVAGFLTNLPAVILGRVVDKMIGTSALTFKLVGPYIAIIIGIILIREAITVWRKYLVENIATRTEKVQTINVFDHLLKTDLEIINQKQIGSWHGKIFRSIQGLIRLIKLGFLDFFPTTFSAIAAIVIALYQKPILGFVMILVIPAGLYIIVKQISSQKGIRVSLLRSKEKIDGRVVESLSGIETVRALNTVDYDRNRIGSIAEKIREKEIKHHLQMAIFDSFKYLNEGFFYVLVICVAIYLASTGVISRGDILVYSILFLSIIGPLREIHRILDEAHESSIRTNDLFELINQPIDRSYEFFSNKMLPANIVFPAVEINNLHFAYGETEKITVLHDLALTIGKGERVGIVGASGCGKSTLIKILLRLIHGYKGDVYVLGRDLAEISREKIASSIAYVPQKPYVFSGTVRENIIYGNFNQDITDEMIIEALRGVNIWQELEDVLGGLDGKIAEGGNNISGGQRQRLALARMMLSNPEIIILDEATSALDNNNEAIIQRNIEEKFSDKTMIIIAHRLTTLRNCDRILVFDQGEIAQEGSYYDLSRNEGLFKSFLENNKVKAE